MTQRQSATILTLLAALYAAMLVFLAPRLDLFEPGTVFRTPTMAVIGAIFAAPAFLALWAVLGRQRKAVRLPFTSWLLAVFFLAAVYGEVRNYGHGDSGTILLAGIAWLTAYLVLLLSLRLLRALRGWRLERIEMGHSAAPSDLSQPEGAVRERQFTIRTLLAWTAAAALLCAGLRWLAPYGSFDADEWPARFIEAQLIEGAVLGLIVALAGLPVLSIAWIVLADGRRRVLRWSLAAITVVGIAVGTAAFKWWWDEDMPIVVLALVPEAGVLLAAMVALPVMRACGYRLMRQRPAAISASLSSPCPKGRFAFLLAAFGLASLLLAGSVPERVELWRQADETQRWATLGWQIDHDANGRVRSLAGGRTGDLAGSEFQIAELPDLQSLDLSHSLLTDVQLAQYPLRTPTLAKLESLNLDGTPIGDAALSCLASFPNLTHLNLSRTNVSDAGVTRLAPLKSLTTLKLARTDVSDEAVVALSQLDRLQLLDLQLTAVTEDGARKLHESLPNTTIAYGASDESLRQGVSATLRNHAGGRTFMSCVLLQPERLHARGPFGVRAKSTSATTTATTPAKAVTDAGLTVLSSQARMKELDLRDSAVTDAGLASLAKLTNLKHLDLRGTQVTEQGCQRLAQVLPQCEILR